MLIFVIFNDTLTNDTVKLEQPGLGRLNHCPASTGSVKIKLERSSIETRGYKISAESSKVLPDCVDKRHKHLFCSHFGYLKYTILNR